MMIWPEVEPPKGWKKNPRAGKHLTRILLVTVAVAGGVTALSAGRSEVLPVVCFLALVLLPFVGPAVARFGFGADTPQNRELRPLDAGDMKVDSVPGGCCLRAYRGPYQKISIPDEWEGMPVIDAVEGLFSGNRTLAFVHLPSGLTAIPARMFDGCDNLPAVVLPPAVQSISSRAFAGCTELKDVYIHAGVGDIAPDAFEGCGNLILHAPEGSAAEAFAKEAGLLCANR